MSEKKPIAVVGGVNVDMNGTPFEPLISGDSNPGQVLFALGGVGRNIAENLSRLGEKVLFLTALGEDQNAAWVRQSCKDLGLDLSESEVIPGGRTSCYLCLNHQDGNVAAAIADMALYDALTPEKLSSHLPALNQCGMVLADANLPQESLTYLAENLQVPLCADPVSLRKASRLIPALPHLFALKPNRGEAAALLGVPEIRDVEQAARALVSKGVRHVFLSLGKEGVWYDNGRERGREPTHCGEILNTSGCGDAFFAAACLALAEGYPIAQAAALGQRAAGLCARSDSPVNPELCREALGL